MDIRKVFLVMVFVCIFGYLVPFWGTSYKGSTLINGNYFSVFKISRNLTLHLDTNHENHQQSKTDVYTRARTLFSFHNCSDHNSTIPLKDLNICGGHHFKHSAEKPELVLFTSMYNSEQKKHIFRFVIQIWSLLRPQVLPVLFLTNVDIVNESQELLKLACDKGWVVGLAPRCLSSGFPLINAMFEYSASHFPAYWYGFSNGDILHTARLWEILKRQRESNTGPHISFVTSRRRNAYVSPADNLSSTADVYKTAKGLPFYRSDAIDLFIYRRNLTLFQHMPSFAVGRRGYDNWLVYDTVRNNLNGLDISWVTPAVHLGVHGMTALQNSHKNRVVDADYNMNLPEVQTSQRWYDRGRLDCIPYEALNRYRSQMWSRLDIIIRKRSVPTICGPHTNFKS